uniref:Os06g0685200 protein n=1 Tax=Macrostomum lignano TaxID=282301 RepID=A0A1I8FGP4_9PLAT
APVGNIKATAAMPAAAPATPLAALCSSAARPGRGISQSPACRVAGQQREAAPGGERARWPAGGRRLGRQRLGSVRLPAFAADGLACCCAAADQAAQALFMLLFVRSEEQNESRVLSRRVYKLRTSLPAINAFLPVY